MLGVKGKDIASATALRLGPDGSYFHVTGTTTITSISTMPAGVVVFLEFDGALTFTHNATNLILFGAANRTTVAGDVSVLISEGAGNWREIARNPKDATIAQTTNTWTPNDSSGAGLTLTIVSASYTKIGRMVHVQARLTYPATIDGSAVRIGGLPFNAAGDSVASVISSSATSVADAQISNATDSIFLVGLASLTAITNAQLSGATVMLSGEYEASS